MAALEGLYTIQTSGGFDRVLELDPETAEATPAFDLDPSGNFSPNALAFSPTGRIFGFDGAGNRLFEIDTSSGAIDYKQSYGTGFPGLAFVDAETLYGLDTGNDRLVQIDPDSGSLSTVGSFDRNLKHVGLAVDFETTEIYTIGGKADGQVDTLYRVDQDDGSLTAIGTTGIDIDAVGVEFVPANGDLYALRGDKPKTTVLRKLDLDSGVGVEIGSVPVGGLANLGVPWPETSVEPPRPPSTATPVPGGGRTPVGSRTPLDPGEYDLRAGTVTEVDVGYDNYYVLTDIPDAGDRAAVTTTRYDLVDVQTAHDAFITATWKDYGDSGIDWRANLEQARQNATEFQAYELLSRAVDVGVDALQTYALAQVNPSMAIGPAVDVFFESINWVANEVTDPYEEGFGKIARTVQECRDLDRAAEGIDSRAAFTEQMNAAVHLGMTLHDVAEGGSGMAEAWSQATSKTGKVVRSVSAYDAAGAVKSIFVGLAIDTAIEQTIDAAIGLNAKITAAAHAHEVARMALSRRIIGLELKRADAALPPAEVVTLTRLKAAYFQIQTLLGYLMETYYGAMSDLWTGAIWDVVADADGMERMGRDIASGGSVATYWTWRMLGYGMTHTQQRLDRSLNAAAAGGETP